MKYVNGSVARVGNLLCIYGPILRTPSRSFSSKGGDENAAHIAAIGNGEINWIVAHSGGGAFEEAIPFGEAILGKDITIVVDGLCASACANYFFLTAARKIVLQDSLVLWHGAPSERNAFAAMHVRDAARSDRLVRRTSVDLSLLIAPKLDDAGQKLDFRTTGWTYGPETLATTFKVKGIVSMWYEPARIKAIFPQLTIYHPDAR